MIVYIHMRNYNKLLKKLSGKWKPNDYSLALQKFEIKDKKKKK